MNIDRFADLTASGTNGVSFDTSIFMMHQGLSWLKSRMRRLPRACRGRSPWTGAGKPATESETVPKHTFKFPPVVIEAIHRHVRAAIDAVDPVRHRQETNYTAALVNRLNGVAYDGVYGSVVFRCTVFDDRGRNSAESRLGADHAITATISDGSKTVSKAILVQAKLGRVADLDKRNRDFLKRQIEKMRQLVAAPKVLEIPEEAGIRFPQVVSGNNVLVDMPCTPLELARYFTARVTTTLDGSTDPHVVDTVQDSSVPRVHVDAKIKGPRSA